MSCHTILYLFYGNESQFVVNCCFYPLVAFFDPLFLLWLLPSNGPKNTRREKARNDVALLFHPHTGSSSNKPIKQLCMQHETSLYCQSCELVSGVLFVLFFSVLFYGRNTQDRNFRRLAEGKHDPESWPSVERARVICSRNGQFCG